MAAAFVGHPLVLINHFPLRYDLVRIPRVPRFSLWCGTHRTEEWHQLPVTVAAGLRHQHLPARDLAWNQDP